MPPQPVAHEAENVVLPVEVADEPEDARDSPDLAAAEGSPACRPLAGGDVGVEEESEPGREQGLGGGGKCGVQLETPPACISPAELATRLGALEERLAMRSQDFQHALLLSHVLALALGVLLALQFT